MGLWAVSFVPFCFKVFNQLCFWLHLLMKIYFWPGFYFRQIVCFCLILSCFCFSLYQSKPSRTNEKLHFELFFCLVWTNFPWAIASHLLTHSDEGMLNSLFALSTYPCFSNQQILVNSNQNPLKFLPVI